MRAKYKQLPTFPRALDRLFSFFSHDHVAYISVQPNASRPRPQVLHRLACTRVLFLTVSVQRPLFPPFGLCAVELTGDLPESLFWGFCHDHLVTRQYRPLDLFPRVGQ